MATRITGRQIDLNIIRIITKIAAIEAIFTFWISMFVTSSRSFISGASPITIDVLSQFFVILLIFAICLFTFGVADSYSEQIKASSWSPLWSILFTSFGIMDSGTEAPTRELMLIVHLTPSTLSISLSISRLSLESMLLSIITI